ncbi:hypothetical protein Tco_0332824 [Tanacetum coccineum]
MNYDLCTSLSKKVGALENELQQTKKTYSTAITKLILKVKKLEQKVKTTKARRRARIVLSEDENDVDDSQNREKIFEIDTDPSIFFIEEEEPPESMENQGSGEKVKKKLVMLEQNIVLSFLKLVLLNTVTTAEVSTATENLLYIRRSAEKKKDKGKGIMTEPEPEKKPKKQLEQERLGHEEAEEINKATQEQEKQEVVTKADPTHVIDWSDHVVLRYHAQLNRPYSIAEVWDQNQSFVPMDSEDKEKGSKKKAGGSRKKTLARKRAGEKQSDQSAKRQKTKYEKEKEELKAYLDLVPREEFAMEIVSLATKYPIVDWKTHVLTETFMYYQIIRVDEFKELQDFIES